MNSATAHCATQGNGTLAGDKGNLRQIYADFQALDHALLDHDLDAARRAFMRLQQNSPAMAAVAHVGANRKASPRRTYLRMLAGALSSGEIRRAQHAFDQLQQTATIDTRDPFDQAHLPASPRSFWSSLYPEG